MREKIQSGIDNHPIPQSLYNYLNYFLKVLNNKKKYLTDFLSSISLISVIGSLKKTFNGPFAEIEYKTYSHIFVCMICIFIYTGCTKKIVNKDF